MGNDPKDSVLNKWNQMHEVSNVFVTDGSYACHLLLVKTLFNFMALTARAADYAVKELKKGNI
jgi:choline dehydrogenase-like flavoprotein